MRGTSLSENEPWVTLALMTVGAGLGVGVELWDTAGRQGAPDGRFEVGDRIGFVEVTTAANQAARGGRRAYYDRVTWQASGGDWYVLRLDRPNHSRARARSVRPRIDPSD